MDMAEDLAENLADKAPVPSKRDRGTTAVIFGFFGMMWFGWGQADASTLLSILFGIGSGLCAVVLVLGIVLIVRGRAGGGAINDESTGRRFGIIVGIEGGAIGVGAFALGITGHYIYLAAWICAVVGVHFLPLARLLGDRLLVVTGILVTAIAVLALIFGLTGVAAPSTVTAAAGLLLVVHAGLALAGVTGDPRLRRGSPGSPPASS